jgi:hypothetical protein
MWGASLFDLTISAQESSVDYMLRQLLGSNYFRIDDLATPDQGGDIRKLDRVSKSATNTLRDRASHAAQRALGDDLFAPFRKHLAAAPTFFHGRYKNA